MTTNQTVPFIDQLDFARKRVLIRVDFNVPLEDGRVADDTRIRGALPTIQYALEQDARVILMSHLGRPKGNQNDAFSLAPAGEVLAQLLDREVILSDRPIGEGPTHLASSLKERVSLLMRTF